MKFRHEIIDLISALLRGCAHKKFQSQDFISCVLSKFGKNQKYMIGQDISAQVGIRDESESGKMSGKRIGNFGLKKRQQKHSINGIC